MKKPITFILLSVSFYLTSSAQILNSSFENWKTDTLYYLPQTFHTGAYGLSYLFTGQTNVSRISGCDGFGVRLESISNGTDSLPGFIYTGKPGFEIEGGGIPYTGMPDSISLCLRHDIVPGDTGLIVLFFQAAGSFVNIALFPLTGSSGSNWTTTTFDLDTFIVQPDTLIMLVTSGNFDKALPGSWVEMDNISFIGTTEQIANGDFESWSVIADEEPEDWSSPDPIIVAVGGTPTVTRDDDAFEGSAAIKIETRILPFEDTLALITNGIIDENGISGGKPYTSSGKPSNLGGFYKYLPVGNDTAFAYMVFSVYNGFTGQTEILGTFSQKLPPSAEWDYFEVPVDLSGAILNPDTVLIVFSSSDADNLVSAATVGVGSTLFLDALAFDLTDGITDWADTHKLTLFPNPATTDLGIEWEMNGSPKDMNIALYSASGQKVHQQNNLKSLSGKNHYSLDVSNFSAGVYILQLSDSEGAFHVREKVVVGK
ncbi:MAG: T9SS type A sorting domain-containing protein [Bacteroidia bacterium]|nr:T9SS type A sorting domain-containing protein [Bacteroidia bacterium]